MSMESFDIVTEENELTGQTKTRKQTHTDGDWHRTVQVWIVNEGKILMQKRALTKGNGPGDWDVSAGGHVKAGQTPEEAIIEETKEELGLEITKDELIFLQTTKQCWEIERKEVNRLCNEVVHLFLVEKSITLDDISFDDGEVIDVRWFTPEELQEVVDTSAKGFLAHPVQYNVILDHLKA